MENVSNERVFLVSVTFSVFYFVGIVSKIQLIEIIDYKEVCFVNLNCKAFYIIQKPDLGIHDRPKGLKLNKTDQHGFKYILKPICSMKCAQLFSEEKNRK